MTKQLGDLPMPAWAETLRRRYLAEEASLFLLHGNVRDLVRVEDGYASLEEYLERLLARAKEVVGFYDYSRGLRFSRKGMKDRFTLAVNTHYILQGKPEIGDEFPREPLQLFPILESFLTDGSQHGAIVMDFVETVVPAGDLSFMSTEDRSSLVTLQRWTSDPAILGSDNLIILLTESMTDVNRKVLHSPQLATIEVPMPDLGERQAFIEHLRESYPKPGIAAKKLADITAGLTLVQIEGIFRAVRQSGGRINFDTVNVAKRRIIEQECFGLLEFVESEHDFKAVGGLEEVKRRLNRVADHIKKGRKKRVPMGVLFVGPMGTGKTFVAEAFANESDLTCVKFKNFREKWVGSTEGNLERILTVIQAMGHVLVMIDEGDRSLGSGGGETDGGTSSRVTARLKEFMSDTSHRGSIVFLMMTNRPDKLDADMKRPGRFDLKLPFFVPQTAEERVAILKALLHKNKIKHKLKAFEALSAMCDNMTGAEMEAILLSAINFADEEGHVALTDEDIGAAIEDYIPSRDTVMMEYMSTLGVFECSSRKLLPPRYRDLDTEELNRRVREMRMKLLTR